MSAIDFNKRFGEAFAAVQSDFARSAGAIIDSLARYEFLYEDGGYKERFSKIKFHGIAESSNPAFQLVDGNWSFLKDFFVSLKPQERLALVCSKIGNENKYDPEIIASKSRTRTYNIGAASIYVAHLAAILYMINTTQDFSVACVLAVAVLAYTASYYRCASKLNYLPPGIKQNNGGDVLALAMTDFVTVKSVYDQEAGYEGKPNFRAIAKLKKTCSQMVENGLVEQDGPVVA